MAKIAPFELYASQYDAWFEKNKFVYLSELNAIQNQIPKNEKGIEIGVGTGKFAQPLGIHLGLEPSEEMRKIAKERGIDAIDGIAENLPFDNSIFDFVLMVTTICFLDNIKAAFKEAHRILKPSGSLIVGFIDKDSPVGKLYQKNKQKSHFYRIATFYSVNEVVTYLKRSGFKLFKFTQTIYKDIKEIKNIEPIKNGYGKGSFVVIKAVAGSVI